MIGAYRNYRTRIVHDTPWRTLAHTVIEVPALNRALAHASEERL